MDTGNSNGCIDFTSLAKARFDRDLTEGVRAFGVLTRSRQEAANLDREPLPPHAPEASPVEARFRRFASGTLAVSGSDFASDTRRS